MKQCLHSLKAGAETGPSGWRNSLWVDIAKEPAGVDTIVAWVQLWAHGALSAQAAGLWQRAMVVCLPKPSGGIRPICLQDSPTKLVEWVLARVLEADLTRAVGPRQFGVC